MEHSTSQQQNTRSFSSAHGAFTKIDHILGQKPNLNKFKIMKILQSMFFDHNVIKLEIADRKILGNIPNYLEIKQRISEQSMGQRRSCKGN